MLGGFGGFKLLCTASNPPAAVPAGGAAGAPAPALSAPPRSAPAQPARLPRTRIVHRTAAPGGSASNGISPSPLRGRRTPTSATPILPGGASGSFPTAAPAEVAHGEWGAAGATRSEGTGRCRRCVCAQPGARLRRLGEGKVGLSLAPVADTAPAGRRCREVQEV